MSLLLHALALCLAPLAPATTTPAVGAATTADLGSLLGEYLAGLNRLRAGDDSALPALRAIGQRLCSEFARCDAIDVLEFYAGLTPDERKAGLEHEKEYTSLHGFVWELSNEGLPQGESWQSVRAEICAELADLIARAETQPDFTPAARAHSLTAELLLSDDAGSAERLDDVRAHVDRAIELFARAGQITPQLEPLWVLGKIHRAHDAVQDARETFTHCLELARRLQRPEYEERALLGLVQLAKDVGDWREVDRLLTELASLRSPAESWPLVREHATRLVHLDQPEAALRMLLSYPPKAASYDQQWHSMLSSTFLRLGDLSAARRELMELDTADQELRELTWASLDLAADAPAKVLERLLTHVDVAGRRDPSQAFKGWSPHSRVQAWSLLGEAALALDRPEDALRWLENAVRGASEWDTVRADQGGGSVMGEWLGLHVVVLLARAHIRLNQPLAAAVVLESFQSRKLRTAAADGRSAEVDEALLVAWAGRFGGGLVTWVIGADHGVVAHVGPDGDAWAGAVPHGRRAVQSGVRRLREAVVAQDGEQTERLAAEIATSLIPMQVETRLAHARQGAATLFLLHGPLEPLPLSVFELDGAPIDERLTPCVLPGLPTDGEAPSLDAAWTLLGNPTRTNTPHSVRLPGAERELADLRRLHPDARAFTGPRFTKDAAFDALGGTGPLHIATHLVYDARCGGTAMASVGLELSQGDVLCARDIQALRPRHALVILTACETAGGRFVDGEGMHGISRAFLESGTSRLVTTLWPVEDEAARAFAGHIHRNLASGIPPARATATARETMRAAGAPAADWAAFRYMGVR